MNTARLDRTFAALSDPTRRAILARLASGEAMVNELARPFAISAPAITRHLNVLERAALIVREREGQFRRCRLNPQALLAAREWIDFHTRFWSESFERLDELLNATPKPTPKPKSRKAHVRRKPHRR
jgi:DNA-binding transcriptional ArsR family regulator